MANTQRKHNPQLHMALNNRHAAHGQYVRHLDTCKDCNAFLMGYLGLTGLCQEGTRLAEEYSYFATLSIKHRGGEA
jgi:hypothetical protein